MVDFTCLCFFTSQSDQSNTLLYGSAKLNLQKLQRVISPHAHELSSKLIILLAYRAIHGVNPSMWDLETLKSKFKYSLQSNSELIIPTQVSKPLATMVDRASVLQYQNTTYVSVSHLASLENNLKPIYLNQHCLNLILKSFVHDSCSFNQHFLTDGKINL